MTIDEARQLIRDTVTALKARHPNGVLGAVLGERLRGALSLEEFGVQRLSEFVEKYCADHVAVHRVPGRPDIIFDLAGTLPPPPVTSRREAYTRARQVPPPLWVAALFGQPPAFIRQDGSIRTEEPPPEGAGEWRRVLYFTKDGQAEAVGDAQLLIREYLPPSSPLLPVLLQLAEDAKAAHAPIPEFSNTITALYRLSVAWNIKRVDAVFSHIARTTGVDVRQKTASAPRPTVATSRSPYAASAASLPTEIPAANPPMATQPSRNPLGRQQLLRARVKHIVEVMPLRDLLELRIPAEYLLDDEAPSTSAVPPGP